MLPKPRPHVRALGRPLATPILADNAERPTALAVFALRRHNSEGGIGPAFEQREHHGRITDQDSQEGFADGPLARLRRLGRTDLVGHVSIVDSQSRPWTELYLR